jgi:hypothetical protein
MFAGHDTRVSAYGTRYNPRSRMASEEQAWRERYDTIAWPVEVAVAA